MGIANWNAFDWVLIAVVIFSMVMAFRTGLVRATLGLVGCILGFLAAANCYTGVGDWLANSYRIFALSPVTARTLGFLLVVAVVAVAFELLGWLLQKTLRAVGLGPLDRILGLVFGFARGCFVGIAIVLAANVIAPRSELVTTSALTPYLFAASHDVSFLVPQYLQQRIVIGAFDSKQIPPQ